MKKIPIIIFIFFSTGLCAQIDRSMFYFYPDSCSKGIWSLMNSKSCNDSGGNKYSMPDSVSLPVVYRAETLRNYLPPIAPTKLLQLRQQLFEMLQEQEEKIDSLKKIIEKNDR
jgi:hypothetical protein